MRTLSPFPYKVICTDPLKRIQYKELDEQLQNHLKQYVKGYNENIRDFKKSVASHWCNMMFTVYGWDFEEECAVGAEAEDRDYEFWFCFKEESHATFFSLVWA